MIKATLSDGGVLFLSTARVISVARNEADELWLSYKSHNGEVSWREIESFEVVPAGRKQS